MLNKAKLIKNFLQQNKSIISGAFILGFLSILSTILIPIFIGKYYQLALHSGSARGKIFDSLLGKVDNIQTYFVYFIILLILKFLFNYFEKYFTGVSGELFSKYLREFLFGRQLRMKTELFERKSTGAYLLRYSGDLISLQNYLTKGIIAFVNDSIFILTATILFFFINVPLTLIVAITFPCIYLINSILNKRLKHLTRKRRNVRSDNLAFVATRLKALLTIKVFNREPVEINKFIERSDKLFRYGKKYYARYALNSAIFLFLLYLMLTIILFTAYMILQDKNTTLDGGIILMYIMLTITTIPVYKRILKVNMVWQAGNVSFTKLLQIINSEEEEKNEKGIEINLTRGDIQIKDLSFSFNNKPIFNNFSLEIPGRSINVITGLQGSGKSTLLKLLTGIYVPEKGNVYIDKMDINNISRHSLRKNCIMVSQELTLLGETIFETISYSRKEEKRKAAENMLHALGFKIDGQENILDHPVEESGRNLSSGQKKILMIARALLTKKKIILLDEPFNELDNFYKMKVIALLNHLKTNHTIIIIDQCNHDALNYDNLIQLNPIQ